MKNYKVPRYKLKLIKDSRGNTSPFPCHEGMAATVFTSLMSNIPHEEMWMLFLDVRSHITGSIKIGQGGVSGIGLLPNDILRPGIVHNASGIILGHNHPSGDCTPSTEDWNLTSQVITACGAVSMPLVDHIVVTDDVSNYYSMYTNRPFMFK